MQHSSDQNSDIDNDNNPFPQRSRGIETDPEESNVVESSTSLENSKFTKVEGTENNTATGNEPISTGFIEESNVITSEKAINKTGGASLRKLSDISRKLIVFSYEARGRPRQPFMLGNQEQQQRQQQNQSQQQQEQSRRHTRQSEPSRSPTSNRNTEVNFPVPNLLPFTPYVDLSGGLQWAKYPAKISEHVPRSLALLVDTEILFVIQQMNVLEFYVGIPEANIYLVVNNNGECLYHVYESFVCLKQCCGSMRAYELHIIDRHDNEVIFLKKSCGSTFLFCCYPVLEVYSPPNVPIGAITKSNTFCVEKFNILDADQNVIFKIHGGGSWKYICALTSFDMTVHALDPQETVVGLIRREYTNIAAALAEVDYFGISFPKDMDVRLKAVILSAAFFFKFKKGGEGDINKRKGNYENLRMSGPSNSTNVINFLQLIGKLKSLKRTGWVLRNVEDPETISGHMYRMSIMTFLIPESSGVDKTKCMKLSLVHDLAECIVGDLTPFCGVDPSEKHRQEEVAMTELTQMIGVSGAEIYTLYKEYEAQVTEESKFVKDLDRLDMILQAFEYEKLGDKPGKLEEFFTSTVHKFHFPWTIDIVKEICKQRNLHINKEKCLVP